MPELFIAAHSKSLLQKEDIKNNLKEGNPFNQSIIDCWGSIGKTLKQETKSNTKTVERKTLAKGTEGPWGTKLSFVGYQLGRSPSFHLMFEIWGQISFLFLRRFCITAVWGIWAWAFAATPPRCRRWISLETESTSPETPPSPCSGLQGQNLPKPKQSHCFETNNFHSRANSWVYRILQTCQCFWRFSLRAHGLIKLHRTKLQR